MYRSSGGAVGAGASELTLVSVAGVVSRGSDSVADDSVTEVLVSVGVVSAGMVVVGPPARTPL